MVRVLIGMNNSWGIVSKDTQYSMNAMIIHSEKVGIVTTLQDPDYHIIFMARNQLAQSAIDYDYDYIFFADADMTWPPFCLEHLVFYSQKHDIPIISGWYTRQVYPHDIYIMFEIPEEPGHYYHIHPQAEALKKPTLLECDAVGAGCLLVRTDVFEKLDKPWFDWTEEKSDDVWFCENARRNGFKIVVATSILCGHVVTIVYPFNIDSELIEIENDGKKEARAIPFIRRDKTTFYHSEAGPDDRSMFKFLKTHPAIGDQQKRVSEIKKGGEKGG